MLALRLETIVPKSGELQLKLLPFRPGERVEVIVLPSKRSQSTADSFPLKNTVLEYEDPTGPVAAQDWDALK